MSNPDFSGSYPPEPAEPGRWGGSRDGQRGERYGDGRHGRGTRDAGERGYRQGRDYEWDRGAADPGYARAGGHARLRPAPSGARSRAAGRGRAGRLGCRTRAGHRGAAAARGRGQGAARCRSRGRDEREGPAGRQARHGSRCGRLHAGAAGYAAGAAPAAGHAMAGYPGSGYPGPDDPRGPGSRDFGPRSGRGRGGPAEMQDRGGRGNGGNGGNGGGNGRGRGSGRPRRKGDWWRHWTWKKALAMCLLTGGGFVILALIGIYYTYSQTPIPAASEFATGQASRVYFRDGSTLVGMFGQTDRQSLQPNQIPAMVRDAMVASEDKHFYNEGGVSPTGILRAAFADLTSGSVQQGGSTITQQLVRNYYDGIGTSQTFTRKIKEIFVAEKLASAKSKAWILTNYMNTVPTGLNMYGFGAASRGVLRQAGAGS